jgi:hypothetical protein
MTDSAAPLIASSNAFVPLVSGTFSGAERIVEALVNHGVKDVFIFPGGTIAPILDVIEKQTGIRIVCPRNEQGAGYAALSYAVLTGQPAVFMVTSGPGVTNAVTPIADAYYDNIPLIVLTGQVGTADLRGSLPVKQRGFQEVPDHGHSGIAAHHGRGVCARIHGAQRAGGHRSADEPAARLPARRRI